jgi:type VI secretion system secreted protein VgrG
MMFLPHIGDEVLVTFVQGDPDRPVVMGSLPNRNAMPPYALPANKTRSTLRSEGLDGQVNEIRFEDLLGEQELFVQAAKDMNTEVGNDLTLSVGHDATLSLANQVEATVSGDLTLEVGGRTTLSSGDGTELDGPVTVSGPLTLSGPVTSSGSLSVISSDLQIVGPMTVSGSGLDVNGSLSVAGALSADGALSVAGALKATDSLAIGGGTTFDRVQAGQATVPLSLSQVATVSISFPRAFSRAPAVVLTMDGSQKGGSDQLFGACVRTVTTTGCTVNVFRLDAAAGWSQALGLNWIAWE